MTSQEIIVLVLTFIIYVISTLTYSARIVGVKTGRIAISFAVFNVFALISRTASSVQSPLLAKTIENSIKSGTSQNLLYVFRWILLSATAASIVGALLMPTFINVFKKLVESFSVYKSLPRILIHGFSKSGIEQFKTSIAKPTKRNISKLKDFSNLPKKVLLMNVFASSVSTVGTLAALYAGCLNPDLRSTCSNLSSIVNGFATILMFLFIDPYVSMLTDDVIRGECSEETFKRYIMFIVEGLIIGTIIAQALLVPAAKLIGFAAKVI